MLFPGRRVSFITTQPQQQIVFLPCTHTTKPVSTPLSPYPHHWARIRTTEPIPTPPSPYPHHWACTHTTEHAPISSFSYLPHPVIPIAHYYHRRVSEVNDQLLRTWGFYFKPQGREPCLLTSTEPRGRGKNWRGLRFSLMCFQLSPPQGSWKKLRSSLSRSASREVPVEIPLHFCATSYWNAFFPSSFQQTTIKMIRMLRTANPDPGLACLLPEAQSLWGMKRDWRV